MTLKRARQEMWDRINAKHTPVDPKRTEQYERDLAEYYPKYVAEARAAAKKTAEMSKAICVG